MVRVSRLFMDSPSTHPLKLPLQFPKSELAVSLDDVYKNVPELTLERLHDMPDDQLLFFWAESAHFLVSGPIKIIAWFPTNKSLEKRYTKYYRNITDLDGNPVGKTATCDEISDDEEGEAGVCEFILIASNRPPEYTHQKVTMQIKRQGGIAYRVNIADIQADAWSKAKATRTLIPFG